MVNFIQNKFDGRMNNLQDNYDFSQKFNNLYNQIQLLKDSKAKIAIYGNGVISETIIQHLQDSIVVIVDKEDEVQKNKIPLCTPNELVNFHFDLIVISVLGREDAIKRYLVNMFNIETNKIVVFNLAQNLLSSYPVMPNEKKDLEKLKDLYKGQSCFILGNGPSLEKIPFELLKNKYTFGSNFIYRKTQKYDFKPTFYMAEDRFVFMTKEFYKSMDEYRCPHMFFPSSEKRMMYKYKDSLFFELDLHLYENKHLTSSELSFSTDFSKKGYSYFSVIYLQLQLAYYLGFTDVYLLGVDYNYEPVASQEKHVHQISIDRILQGQLQGFQKAKEVFEADGRSIKNATFGSKLELFEKVEFHTVVSKNGDA